MTAPRTFHQRLDIAARMKVMWYSEVSQKTKKTYLLQRYGYSHLGFLLYHIRHMCQILTLYIKLSGCHQSFGKCWTMKIKLAFLNSHCNELEGHLRQSMLVSYTLGDKNNILPYHLSRYLLKHLHEDV